MARWAERIGDDPSSPWWAEHRARYHWASAVVRGGVVADVACGSGLGLSALVRPDRTVIAVDLSADALRSLGPGGLPVCADGRRLPLPDGSVDAIASFETIEHVADGAALVAELRRVLRPSGTLCISSPNALVTRPVDGVPRNPFHVKELTPTELYDLLSNSFGDVQLFGQRPAAAWGSCGFWEAADDLPSRLRRAAGKVALRTPPALRDGAARAMGRSAFFPGERDFGFTDVEVDRAHVMVARCAAPLSPAAAPSEGGG